jgi:hypothetical protein
MTPETLRKRRVAAVRAVLRKKNLPVDMRRHWLRVLQLLHGWSVVKRNAGIG